MATELELSRSRQLEEAAPWFGRRAPLAVTPAG